MRVSTRASICEVSVTTGQPPRLSNVAGGPNLNLGGFVNRSSFTFGGANAETIGQALAMEHWESIAALGATRLYAVDGLTVRIHETSVPSA